MVQFLSSALHLFYEETEKTHTTLSQNNSIRNMGIFFKIKSLFNLILLNIDLLF